MQHPRRSLIMCMLTMACICYKLSSQSRVVFAPEERPRDQLIALLDNAKKKIYAAIFLITDKKIAEGLIRAKKRGIDVQVVTDQGSLAMKHNKIELLKEHHIDLFLFKPLRLDQGQDGPLMHNKYALIDDKVWSGSFNWTRSASERNSENALIISEEKELCRRYAAHFETLKARCMMMQKAHQKNTSSTQGTAQVADKQEIATLLKNIKKYFSRTRETRTKKSSKRFTQKKENFRRKQA